MDVVNVMLSSRGQISCIYTSVHDNFSTILYLYHLYRGYGKNKVHHQRLVHVLGMKHIPRVVR